MLSKYSSSAYVIVEYNSDNSLLIDLLIVPPVMVQFTFSKNVFGFLHLSSGSSDSEESLLSLFLSLPLVFFLS